MSASDGDSDWDEDVAGDDSAPTETTPAATAASPNAAVPVGSGAIPSVLVALPMTLALKDHPQLAGGIPAGLTLLYDQSKNVITLLAYDPHKRPMIVEAFDGAKLTKPSLPFALTLGDGEGNAMQTVTLVDAQQRKWTATFGAPHEAGRMVCNIGVASLLAKAAANSTFSQIFVKHDLAKGAGKSVKPKLFATIQVRAWVLPISDDANARGAVAISRVTAEPALTTFNPDITIGGASPSTPAVPFTEPALTTTLSDIEVPDDASASALVCPATLADALAGGKLKTEGGSRLLLIPGSSDLAQEVMKDTPLARGGEGSLMLLQLTPVSVSKKREKKKEKKTAGSRTTEDDAPSVHFADDATDAIAAVSLSPSSSTAGSASSSTAFSAWSSALPALLTPLLPALQTMNAELTSTPAMQQKIVKFISGEMYAGLVEDLGLKETQDAIAAAATEPTAEDGAPAPSPVAIDPVQSAHLTAIQSRMRALVAAYVDKNSVEHKGTLASVVGAWKQQLLPALQPLVDPEGVLGDKKIKQLAAASAAAVAAAAAASTASSSSSSSGGASSAELVALRSEVKKLTATAAAAKKLEEANKTLQETVQQQKKQLAELDTKHTALVMSHVDLEDASQKLTATNKALQVKAQMCAVFESGLSDLRAMLEAEIEEKDKYKSAFQDLSRFQKTTKLTWVPDQAATHCMACKKKFSRFGSGSKGHCRYCGRVFCRACCTESTIPELNFMGKVKICKPCDTFRRKANGERQAEAAAEQDEDDDEDEAPTAKGGKSATSPQPAAGGKGKPSVLSYDSDELE